MQNHRWLEQRAKSLRQPGWRILEIGAGDGTLGKRLMQLGAVEPSALTGVDLAHRPPDWPEGAQWLQRDVLSDPLPEAEVVIANLFLHHFEADALQKLGRRLPQSCRVLLCSEPARRWLHLWQSKLLLTLPISGVTRHDMPASIHAGFLNDELPKFLGISDWKVRVSTTFFGAYRLEAHRP